MCSSRESQLEGKTAVRRWPKRVGHGTEGVIRFRGLAAVFTVAGDSVKALQAWVWIGESGMLVENLGVGRLVNSCQMRERVHLDIRGVFKWGN